MFRITGDGSVRKNGGHWQVVVSFRDDETGRRSQKTFPTEVPCSPTSNRGRAAAIEVKTKIVGELRIAEMGRDAGGAVGLVTAISEYIEYRYKAGIISYQTLDGYRYSLKHIERGFPDSAISDVTAADITAWISSSIEAGASPNVMKRALKLLKQFYKAELSQGTGRVLRNPCVGVETPAPRDAKPNPLTRSSLETLNRTLSNMGDSPFKRAVLLALNTGARVGEVCAITWDLVDFERRTTPIYGSVSKSEDGPVIKDTKGHERRVAPMSLVLYCYLSDTYATQLAQLASTGIGDPEAYLRDCYVVSGTTKMPSPQFISKKYKVLSEALGLKGIDGSLTTFHSLRHTFATQWIYSGGDVKALSDILGHKDATMTLNVYTGCDDLSRRQGMALAAPTLGQGYDLDAPEEKVAEYYEGSPDLYPIKIPARLWAQITREAASLGANVDELASRILASHISEAGRPCAFV